MRVPTATAGRQGRLTLPKELLDGLGVKSGDKLNFDLQMDGAVIVRAASPTTDALSPPQKQAGPEGEGA